MLISFRGGCDWQVGDNSAVNLLPILAGQLSETEDHPELDDEGDINIEKLLPHEFRLNPDAIPFIWRKMKGKNIFS